MRRIRVASAPMDYYEFKRLFWQVVNDAGYVLDMMLVEQGTQVAFTIKAKDGATLYKRTEVDQLVHLRNYARNEQAEVHRLAQSCVAAARQSESARRPDQLP